MISSFFQGIWYVTVLLTKLFALLAVGAAMGLLIVLLWVAIAGTASPER